MSAPLFFLLLPLFVSGCYWMDSGKVAVTCEDLVAGCDGPGGASGGDGNGNDTVGVDRGNPDASGEYDVWRAQGIEGCETTLLLDLWLVPEDQVCDGCDFAFEHQYRSGEDGCGLLRGGLARQRTRTGFMVVEDDFEYFGTIFGVEMTYYEDYGWYFTSEASYLVDGEYWVSYESRSGTGEYGWMQVEYRRSTIDLPAP